MIPIRDNVPSRTTPFVNYAIIAICAVVFLLQQSAGALGLVDHFGMIPKRMLSDAEIWIPLGNGFAQRIGPALVPEWLTPLTCTFLHGGWMHFIGNMWFLWIFGDNVEDRLGHGRYAVFYLAAGVVASLVHLVSNLDSALPTVGASGSIAGVMGAYMLLYPRAQVLTLLPLIVIFTMVVLPAPLFLGIWFALQFFQGVATIGVVESAGVAWWAHIGGFVLGFGVAGWWKHRERIRPPVTVVRPRTERPQIYRIEPRRRRDPWW